VTSHHHLIDRIANWNGVLTGLALWPQALKALLSQSTDDLSVLAFGVIFLNSAVWLTFASHRGLRPLKISSSLNLLASATLITIILRA
jgi:uncharacterized protein with PQ loop repeat